MLDRAQGLHFLGAAALDEWRRVLRPGGLVAFSIPLATDFTPTPSFHAVLADDLRMPSDGSEAAKIALKVGFQQVTVQLSAVVSQSRPRRAFLVWAQAPPQT